MNRESRTVKLKTGDERGFGWLERSKFGTQNSQLETQNLKLILTVEMNMKLHAKFSPIFVLISAFALLSSSRLNAQVTQSGLAPTLPSASAASYYYIAKPGGQVNWIAT